MTKYWIVTSNVQKLYSKKVWQEEKIDKFVLANR